MCTRLWRRTYVCANTCVHMRTLKTTTITILTIFECQFQVFQRFSSSKLVLKTVESCFATLKYYGNGNNTPMCRMLCLRVGKKGFPRFPVCMQHCTTANPKITDVRYQLSTVFSTSLLLENRLNHDNGRQLFWDWQ
jgi:hypothetical protein